MYPLGIQHYKVPIYVKVLIECDIPDVGSSIFKFVLIMLRNRFESQYSSDTLNHDKQKGNPG